MTIFVTDIGNDTVTRAALLALGNASAEETSLLDVTRFDQIIAQAAVATRIAPAAAFLLAYDETSAYDGGHFRWFRARLDRFVYIDRVVVAAHARRHGLGRRLYGDLFQRAAHSGCRVVTCEVNLTPPNPTSDAFHARLGFQPVGEAEMPDAQKVVRYLARHC